MAAVLLVPGCGDDPTAADPVCREAPSVVPGEPVHGRLVPRDAVFHDAFIDYYSLELIDSTHVAVVLTSTELDPILYLFRSAGGDRRVQAQAFDSLDAPAGQAESASLERRLAPGCHLIGASSWRKRTAGAYTLRVDSVAATGGS